MLVQKVGRSDDFQLRPGRFLGGVVPPVSVPDDALRYEESAVTDANGLVTLAILVTDPGPPRNFDGRYCIDGQVYGEQRSSSGSEKFLRPGVDARFFRVTDRAKNWRRSW